jgi:oligoribonuclease (3'-5' exoribonuclease)
MAGQKYPQLLVWTDIETTGLPDEDSDREVIDFSDLHVLEIAVIVTDFDLQPISGYEEVIKLTSAGADAIRANDYVKKMHTVNGLLKASISAPVENTLAMAEAEIVKLFQETTSFSPGEFMIAGSGVAAFDHPLIKAKMPEMSKWLAYYPFDIGIERRMSKIFTGGHEIIRPVKASYEDGVKVHRAMDDVKAHLDEAQRYREWFRKVI